MEYADLLMGFPLFAYPEKNTMESMFAICRSEECMYIRSLSKPSAERNVCIRGPDAQSIATTRVV